MYKRLKKTMEADGRRTWMASEGALISSTIACHVNVRDGRAWDGRQKLGSSTKACLWVI